jgi:hypothetical protein
MSESLLGHPFEPPFPTGVSLVMDGSGMPYCLKRLWTSPHPLQSHTDPGLRSHRGRAGSTQGPKRVTPMPEAPGRRAGVLKPIGHA